MWLETSGNRKVRWGGLSKGVHACAWRINSIIFPLPYLLHAVISVSVRLPHSRVIAARLPSSSTCRYGTLPMLQ